MKPVFRASFPNDSPKIAAFLQRVFGTDPDAMITQPDHLFWKYWAERGDWQIPRSYILEQEGVILAHGSLWPSRILTSYQPPLTAAQVIDWAADPASPGAGLALMKHISKLVDVIFALGGSETTRRILPAFGFRPLNEISIFARPLRPIRQIASHQERSWKSAARVARNTWWSLTPLSWRPDRGWSAKRAGAAGISVWPEPRSNISVLGRNPELFRYCSGSGITDSAFHVVERNGDQTGYFHLVFTPGQARIADAWAREQTPAVWKQIYGLAVLRALEQPGVNEISAMAGLEQAKQAFLMCGFRARRKDPLMIYDPQTKLRPSDQLHFQMVDNDSFFRHTGRPEYET
jgi:hypothetical protein